MYAIFRINACLLLLLQAGLLSAAEDYYSPKTSGNGQTKPSASADPDVRWAQRYYTGKRISGESSEGKKIVTVPLKKASSASLPDDKPKEVAVPKEDDQKDPNPLVIDEIPRLSDNPESLQFAGNLPPGMERGVTDLEASLLSLRGYSVDMATHIKKNGLKGFLYVTPELKTEGQVIGKKIGGGVRCRRAFKSDQRCALNFDQGR